jgi:hypothetical protein
MHVLKLQAQGGLGSGYGLQHLVAEPRMPCRPHATR